MAKESKRIESLGPQEKAPRTWITTCFGTGGPYTMEELQELGYNLPPRNIF